MSSVARSLVALFLSVSLATLGAGCLHHESIEDDEEELEEEQLDLDEEALDDELEMTEVEPAETTHARRLASRAALPEAPLPSDRDPSQTQAILEVDGRRVEVRDLEPEDLSESERIGEQELVPRIRGTIGQAPRACKAAGGSWNAQLGKCELPSDPNGVAAGGG
jgi:hypothetical protein